MTYKNARKLHNEDEIIVKETGESLYVISTEINEKNVIIFCNNGEYYYHKDIK